MSFPLLCFGLAMSPFETAPKRAFGVLSDLHKGEWNVISKTGHFGTRVMWNRRQPRVMDTEKRLSGAFLIALKPKTSEKVRLPQILSLGKFSVHESQHQIVSAPKNFTNTTLSPITFRIYLPLLKAQIHFCLNPQLIEFY